MKIHFPKKYVFVFLPFLFAVNAEAAGCGHHLGAGVGIVHTEEPSQTSVSVGAEYECRVNPFLGIGAFGDHVFSNPSITLLGAPQLLLHPLGGAFFVAASPLFQFGGYGTHVGSRFSTRIPIPLALFVLVPSFAVDFIGGHRNYWLGLGISI
ncbi:MAG: hypothetical protein ACXWQO_01800 [Bdellovibrionota bacterium]